MEAVADRDIRNVCKCECQIFDRQNLSCEILRNHEKVDRIMHLVAKLSDFCLFHPGFFSFFYNRFYLSSHLCEADSLSTSEALIGILAILNVYGSVTKRLRSSSASCECSPQCLPQKAYCRGGSWKNSDILMTTPIVPRPKIYGYIYTYKHTNTKET